MGELASKPTALVLDKRAPTKGTLTVFDDQLVFSDEAGPLLTISRDTIYAVVSERRFLSRGRMRIKTSHGDFVFMDGYRELHRLLAGPQAVTALTAI